MTKEWTVSVDEETWNSDEFFTTKEEAIQYGKNNFQQLLEEAGWEEFADNKVIYVAKVIPFSPDVSVHNVIDVIQEQAYDHGGEHAEGYLGDVSNEAVDELGDLLNEQLLKWLEKHNQKANFYQLANIEEVTV